MCAQLRLYFSDMLIFFMSSHFYLAVKLSFQHLWVQSFRSGIIPIYYQIKLYCFFMHCPGLSYTTVLLLPFLLHFLAHMQKGEEYEVGLLECVGTLILINGSVSNTVTDNMSRCVYLKVLGGWILEECQHSKSSIHDKVAQTDWTSGSAQGWQHFLSLCSEKDFFFAESDIGYFSILRVIQEIIRQSQFSFIVCQFLCLILSPSNGTRSRRIRKSKRI